MIGFLLQVLRLAAPYRVRLGLGIFFGIIAGLMEPIMVFTVPLVYTIVFQDQTVTEKVLGQIPEFMRDWFLSVTKTQQNAIGSSPRLATMMICAIPIVFAIRGIVGYLNAYLLQWTSIRTITDLRVRLFTHLLNMPASFFAGTRSAELMSRVLADTEALRNTISNSLTTLIKDPVTIIGMFALLFWREPRLTALSLLVLPICIVPIAVYGRKGRKAAATIQQISANLNHAMLEAFTGNRIVKAYNLEDAVIRDFRERAGSFISNFMRMVRSLEIPGPLLEFAGSVGVAILLLYAVRHPDPATRPSGTEFLMLVLAIISMYRPMKSVVRLHAQLDQAQAASERVFKLLDTKSNLPEPANPKPLRAAAADIHFENVNFSYGEKPLLRDVNLHVKAGQFIALVGPTGSGKTTLTNLLLRFYDPISGAIRIGNTDIRDVSSRNLREQIAVVTQETILFNDTIRNNIASGRPNATEEEIIAAAKHANAHEFILQKPEGYKTIVGERGTTLSGGQKQRLAIARAILKNAPILILDEATSSLDNESERIVQAALEQLMVGRTTICIAHRLSTIQKADVIVAMQDGRIAEMGSHSELLAKKGVYSNLHQLAFNA